MAYIFLDESNIHKPQGSATFVLVYVAVENNDILEQRVQQVEQEFGITSFHWAESPWPVKARFMDTILSLDFSVKIAVLQNPIHPEKELNRLLPHMVVERNIDAFFIDGKKPRWYARKMKKVLRDKNISVRKLKTVHDTEYAGIRVADMVAGLARWQCDDKHTERIQPFYQRLKRKIIVVIK